jgi:hypothetical protein
MAITALPHNADTATEVLNEVHRTLRPNGRLTVKLDWDTDIWTPEDVINLLEKDDFEVMRVLSEKDDSLEYRQMEARLGKTHKSDTELGYFFEARKAQLEQ